MKDNVSKWSARNIINSVRAKRRLAANLVATKPPIVAQVPTGLRWTQIKEVKNGGQFAPIVTDEVFVKIMSEFLVEHDDEIGGFMWWNEETNEIVWGHKDTYADEGGATLRTDAVESTTACLVEIGEVPNVMWHTHPMFGASFSSTDTGTMAEHLDDARKLSPAGGKFMWICIDRLHWDAYLLEWGPNGLAKTKGKVMLSTGIDLDTDYEQFIPVVGSSVVFPAPRTNFGTQGLYGGADTYQQAQAMRNYDDVYDRYNLTQPQLPSTNPVAEDDDNYWERRPYEGVYSVSELVNMSEGDLAFFYDLFDVFYVDYGDWSDLKDAIISHHGSETAWPVLLDNSHYWGDSDWLMEESWTSHMAKD